jgi:hypothetical protein
MPRKYDKPAIIETVLDQVSNGATLVDTLAKPGMPSMSTWLQWVSEDPALAGDYARARESMIDRTAARALAIAMAEPPIAPDGKVDSGAVQLRRLQVDSLKWILSKWDPKRYGDRLEVDSKTDLQVTVHINRGPALPGHGAPAIEAEAIRHALAGRTTRDDDGSDDGTDD